VLERMTPFLKRALGDNVRLEFSLSADLAPAMTDPVSLEQCITNLAINARDAMPEGGSLRIETSCAVLGEEAVRRGAPSPGNYLCVAVSDTGKGVSADLLDRIFEPFFTTKTLRGGTGLGLTNVYAFMKNSGGHVDVTSELGVGTTFRLFMAEASERVDARSAPGPKSARALRRTPTVLVVDDEPSVARTTSRILERAGYRVLVANGPTQALELASRQGNEIDVAIIDVMMPVMSGPELGRRFTQMRVPARQLFISGYSPASIPEVDANNFLQKPFSSAELLERVARAAGASPQPLRQTLG
jgi:two-component system cell cycle sensor histidine kinase/response regulator CckA